MAKPKSGPSKVKVPAPFGRWGRRLGFRWVFPMGTLPVPYHPLILPMALGLILGMAMRAAVAAAIGATAGEGTWAALLFLAALLGAAMSLPVVVWFLVILGGRLIQAAMILAAMVLLGIETYHGRVPAEWGILPGAYLALFAAQVLLGRPFVRRLGREQENFTAQAVGQSTIAIAGFEHGGEKLIETCDLPRLYCPPLKGTIKARQYHWLEPDDAASLAKSWGEDPPSGWKLKQLPGGTLLIRESAPRPRRAIELRKGRYTAPLWLATGLRQIEARGEGRRWRILSGTAHTVRPIPLFNLFRYTSVHGGSYNQWVAGFPRRKLLELPDPDHIRARDFALLFVARGADGGTHDKAGLPELRAEIARTLAQRVVSQQAAIANLPAFWAANAGTAEPNRMHNATLAVLRAQPHLLLAAEVDIALNWFERERDARSMVGVRSAAALIEAFPLEQLAPHAERLSAIFNSQKLALQWDLPDVPDRKFLPRDTPLWVGTIAGFGLYLSRPQLYEKLGLINIELAGIEQRLFDRVASGEAGLRKSASLVVSRRAATG